MLDTKPFKVTLHRWGAAVDQAQYRGMVDVPPSEQKLVLQAKTKEELVGMISVAEVDGWRKK